ncbi:putative protein [Mycobacterium heckeshornense]|uniref:hypothetical protein n=1 Tax=Mycobacterium heckeshornense TaxID=110505 RepID=UPI001AF17144|nr:putative protein [Mycobacterium heckeshornense]
MGDLLSGTPALAELHDLIGAVIDADRIHAAIELLDIDATELALAHRAGLG